MTGGAPLPPAVRAKIVSWAADTLSALPDDAVPPSLARFRSWSDRHRRSRAGTPLAAVVERDVAFRQAVAAVARRELTELATTMDAGSVPPAADPSDVAALAYLLRPVGWEDLVGPAFEQAGRTDADERLRRAEQEAFRLGAEVAAASARHRGELDRLRAQLAVATADAVRLAKELREEKGARRRAERAASAAQEVAAAARDAVAGASAGAAQEVARALREAKEARAEVEASRRAVREGRTMEDTRVRLLLDTVVEASQSLRRELALPPVSVRPADLVAAAHPGDAVAAERALLSDDPALLDQLLSLPQAHLVVDGYNVTMAGFPDLSLEQQRNRLLTGLSALAARTGAEVTCCFDGAELQGRVPAAAARGVRVRFSRPGETADELIRRLVRAEPPGRPVCVVSSDKEVADGVRLAGARPLSALALVRRLGRG